MDKAPDGAALGLGAQGEQGGITQQWRARRIASPRPRGRHNHRRAGTAALRGSLAARAADFAPKVATCRRGCELPRRRFQGRAIGRLWRRLRLEMRRAMCTDDVARRLVVCWGGGRLGSGINECNHGKWGVGGSAGKVAASIGACDRYAAFRAPHDSCDMSAGRRPNTRPI